MKSIHVNRLSKSRVEEFENEVNLRNDRHTKHRSPRTQTDMHVLRGTGDALCPVSALLASVKRAHVLTPGCMFLRRSFEVSWAIQLRFY